MYVCITFLYFIFNEKVVISYCIQYMYTHAHTMKALILCKIHSANVIQLSRRPTNIHPSLPVRTLLPRKHVQKHSVLHELNAHTLPPLVSGNTHCHVSVLPPAAHMCCHCLT